VQLTNNTFAHNLTGGGNGANGRPGALVICGTFPPGNGSSGGDGGSGFGGAICGLGGTMQVSSGTFSCNRATNGLGGVGGAAGGCTTPTFPPQFISGLPGGPGAAGTRWGGGLMFTSGIYRLENTIVAANDAATQGADVAGGLLSQGHNLIGRSNGSSGWVASDLTGEIHAPLDPRLGPLQNNGGPTWTMALLPGSPAIDQGKATGLMSDQRGGPRLIDSFSVPNAADGDGSDIGSFELQSPREWTQTSAPMTNWAAIACSANGSGLVAAVKGGPIYTSTDSGVTWTPTSAPMTNWSAVACSADGQKLVATVAVFNQRQYESGGPIYVSADGGATWRKTSAPETNWASVASSADGQKLVAVAGGSVAYISSAPDGPIYTSTDAGTNWAATSVDQANDTSVASSADGQRLMAATYSGSGASLVYASTDAALTWLPINESFLYLLSLASSADGTKLVAGTFDPFHPPGSGGTASFYLSSNSGVSWLRAPVSALGRGLVAAAADGTTLVAAAGANAFGRAGPIFVSTNAGAAWDTYGAPEANWSSIVSAADGSKLAAAIDGGGIWTWQKTPAPRLFVFQTKSNLLLSWIAPSASFALQESVGLTTSDWKDVTSPPFLDLTNLHYQVIVPLPFGPHFYRLKH
jgi:hypothetical protein